MYIMQADTGTKLGGDSALAKFDYGRREGKYENKGDLHLDSIDENMPKFAQENARDFWAAADKYERSNGRLYKQLIFNGHRELTLEQNKDLAHRFMQKVIGNEKLPFSLDIHAGEDHNKENLVILKEAQKAGNHEFLNNFNYHNMHFHAMISERVTDDIDRTASQHFSRLNSKNPELGGVYKTDKLKPKQWLEDTRKAWADMSNELFEELGIDKKISHKSYEDQGVDIMPGVHLGPKDAERERKGIRTDAGDANREIKAMNAEIIQLAETQAEIRVLQEEKALRDSYQGEIKADNAGFIKTLDLAFVKDAETGQFIWKNQFEKNEKRIVAFVEHVDKITAHSHNKTAIKAMAQASVEKFGHNFNVTGNDAFKREMWMQGSLLGADVTGYEPTAKDLDDLQRRADDYKDTYKKDIAFNSKVEEMLLLRYAESLKERQEQKMLVNEWNPQPPVLDSGTNEEVKNDGRREPEQDGNTGRGAEVEKPNINAFKQSRAPENRLRKLSQLRMDAGFRQGSQSVLQSHERLNIQQRREEPDPQLRRPVPKPVEPKPVPPVTNDDKAVKKPLKPLGLAGLVSAHRDKDVTSKKPQPLAVSGNNDADIDQRIVMAKSALSIQQKEVERINLDRSDAAEIQRDNEKRLDQLRRQKIDRNVIKPLAFREIMGDKRMSEFEGLAKEIDLKKRTLDQAGFFQKIGLKKEIKKLEERREEINSEIKPKWPKIKALIDETENIMKRDRDSEINILKREIESLKSNDQKLKDALEQAEKQRAEARAELDKLVPPEPEIDNDYGYDR